MKSKLVRIVLFFLILLIPVVTCFSVKIDGVDAGMEWADVSCNILLTKEDSNKVNYGSVSYIVDKNGFDVYFMIYFSDKSDVDYESAGILLTFGNDIISVDCKGNVINPDPNSYVIDSAVNIVENDGCYCELKIGFKKGVDESVHGKLCFIDGEGTHSYHYPFTIQNQYAETKSVVTTVSDSKIEKTTKEKTTVQKTTKVRTTKPKTNKTTKPVSNVAAENKTVVYFLEKDVIVSEVYVNASDAGSAEPVCSVNAENSVQQFNNSAANALAFNNGKQTFRVVCLILGVLLFLLAIGAGLNLKKKESNSEKLKESNSDSKENE